MGWGVSTAGLPPSTPPPFSPPSFAALRRTCLLPIMPPLPSWFLTSKATSWSNQPKWPPPISALSADLLILRVRVAHMQAKKTCGGGGGGAVGGGGEMGGLADRPTSRIFHRGAVTPPPRLTCQPRLCCQKEATSSKANSSPPMGALKAVATPTLTPAVTKSRLSFGLRKRLNMLVLN